MGNVSAPAMLVVVVEIMVGNGKCDFTSDVGDFGGKIMVGNGKCDFTSGVGGFGGKYYGGKWEM